MSDEEEPPECFICTESTPRPHRSACLCKDRYMHTDCFVKMLKAQKGEPKCGVCGALYEDVGWRKKRVVQFVSPCGLVVLLVCCTIGLLGCAINTVIAVSRMHAPHHAFILVVAVVMALGMLAALACVAMQIRIHGWRGVWASRFREVPVIVLGAVRLPKRTTPVELELGELVTR